MPPRRPGPGVRGAVAKRQGGGFRTGWPGWPGWGVTQAARLHHRPWIGCRSSPRVLVLRATVRGGSLGMGSKTSASEPSVFSGAGLSFHRVS